MKYSCYKCESRRVGCHSSCQKYLAQVAEHEREAAEKREKEKENREMVDYRVERQRRSIRRGKK